MPRSRIHGATLPSWTDFVEKAPGSHDLNSAPLELNIKEKNKVAKIEEKELEGHRGDIIADVKKLVEKYRAIFDWDVPDIDQTVADKLILSEVRKALNELELKLLG